MGQHSTLHSSVVGIAMGVVFAGISWKSGAQPGLTAAVGLVWAVAGGTMLYVQRTDATARLTWGLVTGGAVFIASLAVLSANAIPAPAGSALHLVTIGLALLSYHAGMATAHEQPSGGKGNAGSNVVRD